MSVSLGGTAIEKVNEAVSHAERATQVEDERLAALHGYAAYDTIKRNAEKVEGIAKGQGVTINVSIGTTKSKSESSSTTVVAQGSNVQAGGDVKITSTEKDINIKGSSVSGENVTLNAQENLNITASENTNVTEQSSKSSSASVGVGFDLTTGNVSSVTVGGSKAKGEVDANSTTYNESSVTASKDLSFTSGADTNIQGGKLSGEKVTGSVGGDLNIESKQDSNSYTEKNTSGGFGLEINLDSSAKISGSGVTGSVGTSNIDSEYSSVTEQSGIYAGEEGFDIYVGSNTDLKGGVIASEAEAEKNKLSTGTLTWEDIHNKAEYEADSKGIAIDTRKSAEKTEAGVTPNIGMPAADEAESTTKAAIADGTIEIRDKENQKQDVSQLNRDTQNSLNKLGEIFDKDSIKERQELAGLFGELAYKAVGDLAIKNGWAEGSAEKNALHALIGGIMSELGGSGFLAGASGAMVNEMIQDKLSEMFKDDPAMHQWASALIGGVVSEIVANNAQAGASTAASGTKNNYLTHKQFLDYQKELADCNGDEDKEKEVREKYKKICDEQTLAGSLGEAEGEGFEWGVDLDDDGNVKGFTIANDSTAFSNVQIDQIVNFICNDLDKTDWDKNELRTFTFGGKLGNKYLKGGGELGYAVDVKNNAYKVYVAGATADANINIKISDLVDALSNITVSAKSYNIPGAELSKAKLKEAYSGCKVTISKTVMGMDASVTFGYQVSSGNVGIENSLYAVDVAVIYFKPIN